MTHDNKCMKCDKPATHKITKIVDGGIHDFLLCDEHARELSPYLQNKKMDHGKLVELLQHFLKQQEQIMTDVGGEGEGEGEEGPTCSNCGLSYGAYRKTLLLGCSDCYDAFGKLLLNDLRKIHGAVRQHGQDVQISPAASPAPPQVMMTDEEVLNSIKTNPNEMATAVTEDSPVASLSDMEKNLEAAIEKEDFQLAARLRDAIRKRKGMDD